MTQLSDDADALELAWEAYEENNLQRAAELLGRALEFNENHPGVHHLAAMIGMAMGRSAEAEQAFKLALSLDDASAIMLLDAADCAAVNGDFELSLERLEEAYELASAEEESLGTGPNDVLIDALRMQIHTLLILGRREDARALCDQIPADLSSYPAQFALELAYAQVDAGDFAGATTAIEQAAAAPGANARTHYYRALLREESGDYRGATTSMLMAREQLVKMDDPPWAERRALFEKRLQRALSNLPSAHSQLLEGALVVIEDVPGAESVVEGIDPLLRAWLADVPIPVRNPKGEIDPEGDTLRRLFVYQKNIEADERVEMRDVLLLEGITEAIVAYQKAREAMDKKKSEQTDS